MTKVLHILWNAKFGGIKKLMYALAEEQLKFDQVLPSVVIAKEEVEFLQEFKTARFTTHFLNFKYGGGLVEIVDRITKYDVVEDENQLVKRIEHYPKSDKDTQQHKEDRVKYSKEYAISTIAEKLFPIYQSKK